MRQSIYRCYGNQHPNQYHNSSWIAEGAKFIIRHSSDKEREIKLLHDA